MYVCVCVCFLLVNLILTKSLIRIIISGPRAKQSKAKHSRQSNILTFSPTFFATETHFVFSPFSSFVVRNGLFIFHIEISATSQQVRSITCKRLLKKGTVVWCCVVLYCSEIVQSQEKVQQHTYFRMQYSIAESQKRIHHSLPYYCIAGWDKTGCREKRREWKENEGGREGGREGERDALDR